MKVRIVDAYFEPEHWNRVCQATIPGGWVAWIEVNGERQPKFLADSPEELVAELKREFGHVTAPRRIHETLGL